MSSAFNHGVDRREIGYVGRRRSSIGSVPRVLKRVLPYSVVSRYRTARYRARPRVNVDVVVADVSNRRRWLRNTPDTYSVHDVAGLSEDAPVDSPDTDPRSGLSDVVVEGDWHSHHLEAAEGLFANPSVDVVIVARTRFRRTAWVVEEPIVEPLGIAVRTSAWSDVGGAPSESAPVALYERLRDAGYRFVLLPEPGEPRRLQRMDVIAAPSVVVLSLVPLHDVGGGGRSARIALELVRRGYHVTFVAAHGSVGIDLGLRYIHPNLEQRWVWDFDPTELIGRVGKHDRTLVLIEAPAPELISKIAPLKSSGYRVVYDIIDDWSDPSLGWDWYDPAAERQLLESVDAVATSAPDLVPSTTPGALVVPNAVDDSVFAVSATPVPDDFPVGDSLVIGYHGSLYGPWFDWGAVEAVARAYPSARVLIIGDDENVQRDVPENVHFLGPKAQTELPAYVQRFDVGLVPFIVNETTHAVSPLKVYEYLASGVPVAAPPLRSLEGLGGVFTASDLPAAVAAALKGPPIDTTEVLATHSWRERLTDFFGLVGLRLNMTTGTDVSVERRPCVHWSGSERDVRAGSSIGVR